MRVLHIIATPRAQGSNTLRVSDAFLDGLRARYTGVTVDVVDLYNYDLPAIAGTNIDVKYTLMMGRPIDKNHEESWRQIELLIEHFIVSDVYLISSPMWNFSIPYALKYYIDCIIQPGYVFKYDEHGHPVPLVLGKRMVCVTSRGGDYGPTSVLQSYDFQEPYLRAIFGFVGIANIDFINAQPMDMSPALREAAMAAAITQARSLATDTDWTAPGAVDAEERPTELKPQPLQAYT